MLRLAPSTSANGTKETNMGTVPEKKRASWQSYEGISLHGALS